MYQNFKTPAVECLENGKMKHVQEIYLVKAFFQIDPSARNLKEPRNKLN